MRLSLRLVIPLAIVLAAIAYAVIPLIDKLTVQWFVRDLDIRSAFVANTVQDPLLELIRAGTRNKMLAFFSRITQDERLFAIGYCGSQSQIIATRTLPPGISCKNIEKFRDPAPHVLDSPRGPLHVSVQDVEQEGTRIGRLVLGHDMSFIQRRSEETKKYVFYFFVGLAAIVSLITVIIAQLSWRGWVQGFRALLRGEGLLRPAEKINVPELRPLARDLRSLIRDIESEYRPRDESQLTWTADALRSILRQDLRGDDIMVVSNREPYLHVRRDERIEVQRPASGL